MIGPETDVVSLAGKMVLPRFQDGHVHLLAGGVELGECTLFTIASSAAIADSIRACAAAQELTSCPDANPSRALLDRVVPDRPAIFDAADGHSAWANSTALDLPSAAWSRAGDSGEEPLRGRATGHSRGAGDADDSGGEDGARAGVRWAINHFKVNAYTTVHQ
jgi:predicted amidohydrolase YtcJ